jgi:hypothetical protein
MIARVQHEAQEGQGRESGAVEVGSRKKAAKRVVEAKEVGQ